MKLNKLDEVFIEKDIYNRFIALYLGKSESTISLWRNNKRQPTLEELKSIARLLRMNVQDLIEPSFWDNEKSITYEEFVIELKQEEQLLSELIADNKVFMNILKSGLDIEQIRQELVKLNIISNEFDRIRVKAIMSLLIKRKLVKIVTLEDKKKVYISKE